MHDSIWQILKIEKTTDTRFIRKAYARESKTCHPEENPEEFQRLYEAYRQALDYAQAAEKEQASSGPVPSPGGPHSFSGIPVPEEEIIKTFFRSREDAYQRLSGFLQQWEEYLNHLGEWGAIGTFLDYLKSGEFSGLKDDRKLLAVLTEYFGSGHYVDMEVCSALASLYEGDGSQSGNEAGYRELKEALCLSAGKREEDQRLRDEAAQKERERSAWEAKKNAAFLRLERRRAVLKSLGTALASITIALVLTAAVISLMIHHSEKVKMVHFLETTYPDIECSGFKRIRGQEDVQGAYRFHASALPGEELTVEIKRVEVSSNIYKLYIAEDVGTRLAEKLGKEFGLLCASETETEANTDGKHRILFAYYKDPDEVAAFCSRFGTFFKSREFGQLTQVSRVAFLPEDILFPERMINGGEDGILKPAVFALGEIPGEDELSRNLTESYILYMYSYEPWNLTEEEMDRWDGIYRNAVHAAQREMEEETGGSGRLRELSGEIEKAAGACIYFYDRPYSNAWESGLSYGPFLTIGNLYRLLAAEGVPVELYPDKTGFLVKRKAEEGGSFAIGKDKGMGSGDAVTYEQALEMAWSRTF